MIAYPKSSPFRHCAFVLLLGTITLALTSCADTKWPTFLTGEPDDSVLLAPRVVGEPPSRYGEDWPLLGNVPDAPKDFTSQKDWKKIKKKLKTSKKKSLAAKRRIDATAPVVEPMETPEILPSDSE
ncbi:MAG: hypothetical protein PHX43_03620 [Alphaproteobacteria bacterium]|nr:hypothetical protein [Alphaproteobacteria bacterium]